MFCPKVSDCAFFVNSQKKKNKIKYTKTMALVMCCYKIKKYLCFGNWAKKIIKLSGKSFVTCLKALIFL